MRKIEHYITNKSTEKTMTEIKVLHDVDTDKPFYLLGYEQGVINDKENVEDKIKCFI